MSKCPRCGAQLRFDIPSQRLICDYCGANLDPYEYDSVHRNKDAKKVNDEMAGYMNDQAGRKQEAGDTFVVTVYTCPNCGGEIISTSNSATEVCSYCGAQVMMEQKEGTSIRPDLIVPFSKDRDELRKICGSRMRRSIFAPKELRDPRSIQSFRGIYMPFWIYDIAKKGRVTNLPGTYFYREGDYDCTDHYSISLNTKASYQGIAFDSASSFEDDISDEIAPYRVTDAKPFTPSIISGFYADRSDVPQGVYMKDALAVAENDVLDAAEKETPLKKISIERKGHFFSNQDVHVKSALLPVWFMAYRKKDRVAYAVINGATGKMALDMPVDPIRYVIFSLLLAVPLFALFYIFFDATAANSVVLTGVMALFGALINTWEIRKIARKDSHQDDRGYVAANKELRKQLKTEKKDAASKTETDDPGYRFKDPSVTFNIVVIAAMAFLIFMAWILLSVLFLAVFDLCIFYYVRRWLRECGKKVSVRTVITMLVPLAATAVLIADPIYDSIFYAVSMVQAGVLFLQMTETIAQYNILATRKLPQFRREGGDNRA